MTARGFCSAKSRVKAQMLIAGRRWDVRLDNGVTIQLPEGDPAEALAKLAEVDSATGLLSKDIELVDMRLSDRMVVRLMTSSVEPPHGMAAERPRSSIVQLFRCASLGRAITKSTHV